jgi:hypothetical protein
MVSAHHRMAVKNRVNGPAKLSLPLPMNYPYFKNTFFTTCPDIFLYHVSCIPRPKRVKVYAPVDRNFNRLCFFYHFLKFHC